MTKGNILIVLGALIVFAPFSGLPESWRAILLPIIGILIGGIGYSLRRPKETTPSSSFGSTEAAE